MPHFSDLATAAREIKIGDTASFTADCCDLLYNADEQTRAWIFDVVQNDVTALIVRRQYQSRPRDLTEYR